MSPPPSSVVSPQEPASASELAQALSAAAAAGQAVRFSGGRTKWEWGSGASEPGVEISTLGLGRILEHNAGDLTAVVDAGVPLRVLQEAVAEAGQMLALDPPLGAGDATTVGGVVATGDSGPLRHGYGSARDLVVGITVALSDGTVARGGGKVIKNVAGYDLAKLFTGSHGTLGAIVGLAVRLHPLPPRTATAAGRSADPAALASAAAELSHAPLELQSLDVRWEDGAGALLARFGGASPGPRTSATAEAMGRLGLDAQPVDEDTELWDAQRDAQRSERGVVVRVSTPQTRLGEVLLATERAGGRLVGRAGLGLSWITVDSSERAAQVRSALAPSPCVLLDAEPGMRDGLDVWGRQDPGALGLMRRVKERFDPAGACGPGVLAV